MPPTTIEYTITRSITTPSGTLEFKKVLIADSHLEGAPAVDDGQTDKEIDVAFGIARLKAIYIVSDQDVTIETNDPDTPDDTIDLQAGVPIDWFADDYFDCPFTSGGIL